MSPGPKSSRHLVSTPDATPWAPRSADEGAAASGSLIDLFHERVWDHADRVAIRADGVDIGYADLNRRANQIAHLLVRAGVGRNDVVAILMERRLVSYIAILGVLKAGAAYLPIDPAYPKARIRHIFMQSRPRGVLTTSSSLHHAEADPDAVIVLVDEVKGFQKAKKRSGRVFDAEDVKRCPVTDLPRTSRADDLAYVIFTSGSTGAPKGVMVEHGSVVNLIRWASQTFEVTPGSRVLQNYSLAFDPSVQEIFTALLSGAALVAVPDEIRTSPARLLSWLDDNAISHWDSVPSLWYRVVDHVSSQARDGKLSLPHLKTLILGGESLSGEKVRAWMDRVEQTHRIYNVYGLTETTVSATCYLIPPDVPRAVVPIGTPLWNHEVHIVDEALRPCPPGVEGELCITGVGVARGYINAPQLTSAAFLEGILEGRPADERLYRTGDFARRLPSGALELVGRKDEQVKVRGHRIELGEIESALRELRRLGDVAVVVADEPGADHRRIIAFYTCAFPVTPEEVRAHLLARLPGFMVPHQFVRVLSIPLTTHGKVDKKALLEAIPDRGAPPPRASRPVNSATEALLVSIWRKVLKVDLIGIDDDFFSLGGDSLLTVMVQHGCEQAGIRLRSIDLFRHATIRRLARHIDESTPEEVRQGARDGIAIALSPEQRRLLPPGAGQVLPLLGSQRQILDERARVGGAAYMPQAVLHCEGRLDLVALEKAVNVLISRHEALRTIFRVDLGDEPVQVVLSDVRYEVVHEDLSTREQQGAGSAGDDARRGEVFVPRKHLVWREPEGGAPSASPPREDLARQDAHVRRAAAAVLERGFDLSTWPLFHIAVYKRSDTRFDIVWTIHHIIMDGWSTAIFYWELSRVYSSIVTKKFLPLPPQRRDFSDVVKQVRSKCALRARAFWQGHLSRATFARLPPDRDARGEGPWQIEHLAFSLDEEATQALRQYAREQAVTLNTVCLAAYYLFLRDIIGQDDLTAGVVTSGRASGTAGTESVIGNLINLVPLRLDLGAQRTFGELVRLVQHALSDVIEHDHLCISEIVAMAAPGGAPPRLSTVFVSENYPSPEELGLAPFETFTVTGVTARECNSYPFTVISSEEGGKLVWSFEYAAELFTEDTVRAWSARLLEVLRGILRERERQADGAFQ